jgi:hypothetical protein
MYLKEVIVISFIALLLLLLNLIVKYYFIFKRGYRISNLILIKFMIRTMSIIFFTVILILGLGNVNSKNNKDDVSCINYILSIKTSDNNIVLEKSTISKVSELVNSQNKLKASFLIHISNKNKYYLALPSTSKSTFLNLIQSPNLHFDITTLKSTAYPELITNNTIPVLLNSTKTVQIGSESNMGTNSFLNYLINWFEIPFIHLYLLFLTVVLVSFDLFTKFRIIKK